jgi:hypothetical protein
MVAGPEDLEQVPVRNLCGIVIHLHRLGVVAEASVGGMFLGAPRVAHPGAYYPCEDPEPGLHAPESPEAEGEGFHPAGQRPIKGWCVFS